MRLTLCWMAPCCLTPIQHTSHPTSPCPIQQAPFLWPLHVLHVGPIESHCLHNPCPTQAYCEGVMGPAFVKQDAFDAATVLQEST